ncbi:phosphate ABC transporter ATP-binding protein [Litorilinea aerophila]|uniref:Phosphate ABC transporter ATP-binding protein n=2 Tax=Litorilinea aerophila TaxID=1204385 RepID=A0A540VI71_9CHLR|nr:phosphate ABC transporter ATP-binding protein [Litorilinea aerophila]GIV80513.1 MAG: phosphate ABC transporter ATP-binding protein [Litorilinea sp.]GIV82064.1 MAG: phosphate ABC transporter ATP-binding protein [Anaerolineae bacterium]
MADSVMVEVRRLSLERGGVPVLREVSLTADRGQIVGLLGPSGSGKSTLLRCINRLLEPPPQTVFVDGRDVTRVDVIQLRRQVGMVFQQPVLFPGTVADNLRYGPALRGESLGDAELRALLEQADLDPALADRPASELSGGQAQRVALARTLANRPQVLLMDEPTSALDPASRRHIEEQVRRSSRKDGLAVIWVTHDVEQAEHIADYLYLLVDGQIVDQGEPAHVLHAQGDHEHLLSRFAAGELAGRHS